MASSISPSQWAVALVVILLAIWWGSHKRHRWLSQSDKKKTILHTSLSVTTTTTTTTTDIFIRQSSPLTIYAIGDLHGDVECARQWVARTNVIHESSDGTTTTTTTRNWKDEANRLVFVGDYVDKGITSKQTLEFVKNLTETFPEYVTAIMGNHELELLRDRTETLWGNGHAGYYQLVYGAVHPAEYLNYLSEDQRDDPLDQMVVDALYNASLYVYGTGKHRSIFLSPDLSFDGSILHFVPESIRETVQSRLKLYQRNYLDAFRSGTVLGDWLENLPIAAVIDTTLFVHGGIAPKVTQQFLNTIQDINDLNEIFRQHATESKLGNFLKNTTPGQIVYHLVTYRGNHHGDCTDLVLPETITKLAVGHTPGKVVRNTCPDGTFLALDSSLSRWFRNSGNQYCKGDVQKQFGNYVCQQKSNDCQGQIARIQRHSVDILSMAER